MILHIQNMAKDRLSAAIAALVILTACAPSYSYKEKAVPEPVKLSQRLQSLFAKTKLVCFGRYAIEVPLEAKMIIGSVSIPADVKAINGGLEASKLWVAEDVAKIKYAKETAEIIYNGKGPVESSWQIRYFEDEHMKKRGAVYFQTYINKGDLTFFIDDSVQQDKKVDGKIDTEAGAANRQAVLARNLRLRAEDEVPAESGFCVEHAFISDKLPPDQETASAGIFLPSFPDVTFSISSNKDAYGDYPPAEFDKYKPELSLLYRIGQAKSDQGTHYPDRTVLREGKRDVQHWHGEESLIKRADGVHDFEWALVGTPRDVANPSEFGATMFTKVEHNTVGAAKAASLSDDEAVALWDKLLSGLKFRVKVPGAPKGSYHIDHEQPPA